MKKLIILLCTVLLNTSCNSQERSTEKALNKEEPATTEQPKGSWKVDREFDENGNLIRYDSIYSWSSSDHIQGLTADDQYSLLQSFRSRFQSYFSGYDSPGFPGFHTNDSLFMKGFFNNDFFESEFGKDFMDLDQMRQRMEARQREFMKRYGQAPDKTKDQDKDSQGI